MKKFLKVFCACLMVCLLALPFAACGKKKEPKQPEYWENDVNAIKISNYDEFKTFFNEYRNAEQFSLSKLGQESKYVVLTNDIDCGGDEIAPIITKDNHGLSFKLEGANHTLKNFKLTTVTKIVGRPGTSTDGFHVISLFPVSYGGQLLNIEFKDVEVKATLDAEARNDVHVGIVGYSAAEGAPNAPGAKDLYETSLYKNVKITNMKVDITSKGDSANNNSKYPLSIGSLIGLDSDTTQAGNYILGGIGKTKQAVRENITVSNFQVKVDKQGTGALFVGGIAGQMHWQDVLYKNCNVQGTVEIKTTGTNNPETDEEPETKLGAESLGDCVFVGGIAGADVKNTYKLTVEGGKAALDVKFTGQEDLLSVGNVLGLLNVPTEELVDEKGIHVTSVNTTFVGACTYQLGEAAKQNVTDAIKTTFA